LKVDASGAMCIRKLSFELATKILAGLLVSIHIIEKPATLKWYLLATED
jgi:hypothetical protein